MPARYQLALVAPSHGRLAVVVVGCVTRAPRPNVALIFWPTGHGGALYSQTSGLAVAVTATGRLRQPRSAS